LVTLLSFTQLNHNQFDLNYSLLPIAWLSTPKVLYINALTEKDDLFDENKDKSGIYIWTNKLNGKRYIGSAIDLGDRKSGRLNKYYRPSYLASDVLGSSAIRSAIIKYNHKNFMVGILEYCSKTELSEREQYYIDKLSPEYNILKVAYSSFGYKHTMEAINKMKGLRINFSPSESHREAIRLANLGKVVLEETRLRISKSLSKEVYVYSPNKELLHIYPTVTIAKKELHISTDTIKKYCVNKKVYNIKYIFSYGPLNLDNDK
jgi:group I intron endonuclease